MSIFYLQAWCERLEMNLVDIQSAAENEFIWQLANDEDAYYPWIGLSKRSNGEWMWQDGGALNYTNWGPGEPYGPKEACMSTYDGQWFACTNHLRYFLCKK